MHPLEIKIYKYGRKTQMVNDQEAIINAITSNLDNVAEITDFIELEQGCETWLKGHQYPIRGCFQYDKLDTVTQIKRVIPTIFRSINRYKILGVIYFYFNWKEWLAFIHHAFRDVFMEPKYYSQPVREVYRVLSDKNIDTIRDIICAILEYDTAYRYRFQDIVGNLKTIKFVENPYAEIERLIRLYTQKENGSIVKDKLGTLLPFIKLYLRFNKKILRLLKEIVTDIDLNEIKSNPADRYWQRQSQFDYVFDTI